MPRPRPTLSVFILATLLFPAAILVEAGTADAQSVKRSAGTKRSGTTSSGRRGGSSISRSSRSSRAPVLPSEKKAWEYEEDEDKGRYYGSGSRKSYDDDEEIEPDVAPTLGRACIYGQDDQVVYRPEGAWCRGDAPLAKQVRPRHAEEQVAPAAPARRRAASAFRPTDASRKSRKKVRRKTSAGCLYSESGVVLYGPETSDCVHGIGAPANARLAPPADAAGPDAAAPQDDLSSGKAE